MGRASMRRDRGYISRVPGAHRFTQLPITPVRGIEPADDGIVQKDLSACALLATSLATKPVKSTGSPMTQAYQRFAPLPLRTRQAFVRAGRAPSAALAASADLPPAVCRRYVGHRHFRLAGELGRLRDQFPYVFGDTLSLRRGKRRNEARRQHPVKDDVLGRARVAVRELSFPEPVKTCCGKYLSPCLRVKPRGVACMRLERAPQLGNPRDPLVANVPDEPEGTAG